MVRTPTIVWLRYFFHQRGGLHALGCGPVYRLFRLCGFARENRPEPAAIMGEIGYGFVADMIRGTAGEEGLRFFPFVFTLFFFILFANLIGMCLTPLRRPATSS